MEMLTILMQIKLNMGPTSDSLIFNCGYLGFIHPLLNVNVNSRSMRIVFFKLIHYLLMLHVQVHIEQGPVLESVGLPLAVVKGIAGQTRLKVSKCLQPLKLIHSNYHVNFSFCDNIH